MAMGIPFGNSGAWTCPGPSRYARSSHPRNRGRLQESISPAGDGQVPSGTWPTTAIRPSSCGIVGVSDPIGGGRSSIYLLQTSIPTLTQAGEMLPDLLTAHQPPLVLPTVHAGYRNRFQLWFLAELPSLLSPLTGQSSSSARTRGAFQGNGQPSVRISTTNFSNLRTSRSLFEGSRRP